MGWWFKKDGRIHNKEMDSSPKKGIGCPTISFLQMIVNNIIHFILYRKFTTLTIILSYILKQIFILQI